ncbi:hypothetical protein FJY94_00595 [Candidatus Kaiserbacteria bacterium]|nr:hypothetical protein [Candidatus Kaiserbacteria bacterium]
MQIIIIAVVVALLGLGASLYWKPTAEPAPVATNTPQEQTTNLPPADPAGGTFPVGTPGNVTDTPTQPTPATAPVTSTYKDGTFSADGVYQSPAGNETVHVSVTLKGDVVTATTFKGDATNPGSVNNQKKFSGGYTQLVVGKKLDDIKLSVVNGSSLTPGGFMDALADIKAEARI